MDDEPEVTREQMDETRASLSDKLETLEQHVVDSVQGATTAVTDTVESVKDAVHDTVETVKDTLNLQLQMKRHPWAVVAGSIALGYLGGYLLLRGRSQRSEANGWSPPTLPEYPRITEPLNGTVKGHRSVEEVSKNSSQVGWLSVANELFGTEITMLKGLAISTVLGVARDTITQSVPEQMKSPLANAMDRITVKLGGNPVQGVPVKE